MNKKYSIAIVNTEGLDNWSGSVSVWAYNQAKLLRNKGHEVHLFVKNKTPLPNNLKGIKLHFIEFDKIKITLIEKIKNIFQKEDLRNKKYIKFLYDEIYSLYIKNVIDIVDMPDINGEAIELIDSSIPILVRAHHNHYIYNEMLETSIYPKNLLINEKATIDKCKNISFVSDYSKKIYGEYFDIKKKNIFNILYPLEMKYFSAAPIKKKNGLNILFVGRFNDKNGIKQLINFIDVISDVEGLVINFHVVGGENADALNELKQLKKDGANIDVSNFVSRPKMLDKYKNSDIVIFPQMSESISYSLLEAMSCQRVPIVASNSGNSDFIIDGVNGFIFNSGDIAHLVIMIKKLYGNYNLLRYIGENSKKYIEKEFNFKKLYNQSISVYKSILE